MTRPMASAVMRQCGRYRRFGLGLFRGSVSLGGILTVGIEFAANGFFLNVEIIILVVT